jgi:hypothetical protein
MPVLIRMATFPKGMRASAVCVDARVGVWPAALHHLAAGSGASRDVLDLGEALALAGILGFAGGCRAALAGALALAGVGAGALHAFGVRGGGEGAGSEDRSMKILLNARAFVLASGYS